MKKYENFCNALKNLNDIYNYNEPYDNVVLTGLVALYEICFEQAWKASGFSSNMGDYFKKEDAKFRAKKNEPGYLILEKIE